MLSISYDKKYGLIFWGFFPVLFLILVYRPFQLPIQFDRAYLLYLSQAVFRGESLYEDTTFGYTPLSVLLVGLFMKLASVFSLDTIQAARVFGIMIYGVICSSVYSLLKRYFGEGIIVLKGMILFIGLDYILILSGINAEPKIWVLLFTVLGITSYAKEKYLLTGFYFALGAMCWHVAVISLFACTTALLFKWKDFPKNFKWLVIGVALGTLPIILYLTFTDQWIDFWNQAVTRKIKYEGKKLGEAPWQWLQLGIYPYFITEALHFLLAGVGFVMLLFRVVRNKLSKLIGGKNDTAFLISLVLWWGLFNSIEFQSNVDLFPLIPIIILLSTYFLKECLNFSRGIQGIILVGLIVYCFFNAVSLQTLIKYDDQKRIFSQLDDQFGNALAVGTLEYYVLKEETTPTKYLNFHPYENLVIRDNVQCIRLNELVEANEITYIIDFDPTNRGIGTSPIPKYLREKVNLTKEIKSKKIKKRTQVACLSDIFEKYQKVQGSPDSLVFFPSQKALIKDLFFDLEGYGIYKLTD